MFKKILSGKSALIIGISFLFLNTSCNLFEDKNDKENEKPENENQTKPITEKSGLSTSENTIHLQRRFYKHFTGLIGDKHQVVVDLNRQGKQLTGKYHYVTQKKNIGLEGVINNAGIELFEYVSGEKTGHFTGSFQNTGLIEGVWQTINGRKKLSFQFSEDYTCSLPFTSYFFSERFEPGEDKFPLDIRITYLEPTEKEGEYANLVRILRRKFFNTDFNSKTFDTMAKHFSACFRDSVRELLTEPVSNENSLEKDKSICIRYNHNNIVSIEIADYENIVSRHGHVHTEFINYNITQKKICLFTELFDNHEISAFSDKLDSVVQAKNIACFIAFNEMQKEEFGRIINSGFYFIPGGIGLFFDAGEISPFVDGDVELVFSDKEIAKMMGKTKNELFM